MTFAVVGTVLLFATPLHAQEQGEACPAGVSVDLPIRGIHVQAEATRTVLDMTVCNGTAEAQQVDIEFVDVPEEWVVEVREPFETFRISSLFLSPGASKELELRPDPANDAPAGTYTFTMRLSTPSGGTIEEVELRVDVLARETVEAGGIALQATYPVLRGPSTSRFDFSVGVRNDTGSDGVFDLSANVPSGWDVFFTPAFGADRETTIISTLSIPFGVTQRVAVRVTPGRDTPPGEFPIVFFAGNEDVEEQMLPSAEVTGIFDIFLVPESGRLSIDASAGDREPMFIQVQNLGTGVLEQTSLVAEAPEGWEVTFDPTGIDRLDPLIQRRVEVGTTPANDAIPGDYVVTIRAEGPEARDVINVRVTVEQSTIWGWFGIGIVVLVLGGLVGLFVRLGRR